MICRASIFSVLLCTSGLAMSKRGSHGSLPSGELAFGKLRLATAHGIPASFILRASPAKAWWAKRSWTAPALASRVQNAQILPYRAVDTQRAITRSIGAAQGRKSGRTGTEEPSQVWKPLNVHGLREKRSPRSNNSANFPGTTLLRSVWNSEHPAREEKLLENRVSIASALDFPGTRQTKMVGIGSQRMFSLRIVIVFIEIFNKPPQELESPSIVAEVDELGQQWGRGQWVQLPQEPRVKGCSGIFQLFQ